MSKLQAHPATPPVTTWASLAAAEGPGGAHAASPPSGPLRGSWSILWMVPPFSSPGRCLGHSQPQALQVTARPGGLPLAASLPLSLAPPPSHGLTLGTSRVVLVPLGLQKRGPQGDSQAEPPSAALHSHLPGQGTETWAWGPPGHPSLRLCLPFGLQEPCLCHYCDHTLRCQLPGHSVYARVSIIRLYKYGDAYE